MLRHTSHPPYHTDRESPALQRHCRQTQEPRKIPQGPQGSECVERLSSFRDGLLRKIQNLPFSKAAQNGLPTRPQGGRRPRRTIFGTSQGDGRPRTKLEAVFSSRHRMSTVASHRNIPILTISVAVVRKMLEAVAGSAPSFFSARGISAPDSPLVTQLATMARKTTIASIRPFSWWWMVV